MLSRKRTCERSAVHLSLPHSCTSRGLGCPVAVPVHPPCLLRRPLGDGMVQGPRSPPPGLECLLCFSSPSRMGRTCSWGGWEVGQLMVTHPPTSPSARTATCFDSISANSVSLSCKRPQMLSNPPAPRVSYPFPSYCPLAGISTSQQAGPPVPLVPLRSRWPPPLTHGSHGLQVVLVNFTLTPPCPLLQIGNRT